MIAIDMDLPIKDVGSFCLEVAAYDIDIQYLIENNPNYEAVIRIECIDGFFYVLIPRDSEWSMDD